MEEIWKDIYFIEDGVEWDYRGLYQVSNLGKIKSLKNDNAKNQYKDVSILKPHKNNKGYLSIVLYNNNKRKVFMLHRIVAHMFCDGCCDGLVVNHKDENPSNNYYENLEWTTQKENCNYGTRNKRMSNSKKGKSFSDKHKQNLSKSRKGKNKGRNNYNLGLLIERWDKNGNLIDIKYQFEYVEMGFDQSSISKCCKGKYKSHKGFIFKYHKGEDKNE